MVFKNNAPFINCISKINGVKIDKAEDLDAVMPMYNLLEYSKNYRKTTGSLWNYYSFRNYYVPKVKVDGFNVLIHGKSFFDLSVKNDKKLMKKLLK